MTPAQDLHPDGLSQLLNRWTGGDQEALKSLVPLVYSELRRLAHNRLRHERQNHTLQTTALVHEAYLRLAENPPNKVADRKHFLALAAGIMRQVLVDHAREKLAQKRDGGVQIELDSRIAPVTERVLDVLEGFRAKALRVGVVLLLRDVLFRRSQCGERPMKTPRARF